MKSDDLKQFSLLAEFTEEERELLGELLEQRELASGKSAFPRWFGTSSGRTLHRSGSRFRARSTGGGATG